jgi:nucleoside-diphosphate-sugar epimerase
MTYADTTKAYQLLGYEPKVDLEEGIPKFIAWYKMYKTQQKRSESN